jgi:ketosteroid isomerase-like protein
VATGQQFYERQIRLLQEKDADRLVDEHYAEDATVVSFATVVRGADALKEYFRGYLAALGDLTLLSTDNFQSTGDTILFEATVETGRGRARVYDAIVLEGDKIKYHFTGVM